MTERVSSPTLLTLEQVLDRNPLIVSPARPILDLLSLMGRSGNLLRTNHSTPHLPTPAQASCALVMQDAQLLGILTEQDLARWVELGRSLEGVTAAEVMTNPVITLRQADGWEVFTAFNLFRQHQICHLPVMDIHNQLVGVVTQSQIVQAFNPAELCSLITQLKQTVDDRDIELQQATLQCQQLAQALEASESRQQSSATQLQAVLKNARTAITRLRLFADDTCEIDYCSPGCAAVYSYTDVELLADPWLWRSRVLPEDWENVLQPSFEHIFAERPITVEFRFLRRDGSICWLSETITSSWEESSGFWIVTKVALDISERKQIEEKAQKALKNLEQSNLSLKISNCELQSLVAEQQVLEAELRQQNQQLLVERQRYQDLFNFAPDGYVVTDLAGKIQEANQAIARQLSTDVEFLIGNLLINFIPLSDRRTLRTRLNDFLSAQLQPWQQQSWQLYLEPRHGRPFAAEVRVAPICNGSHELVALRWLVRDITERIQAETLRDLQSFLIQNLAEGVCLVRAVDGVIVYTNPKLDQIFGYEMGELIGQPVSKLNYDDGIVKPETVYREIANQLDTYGTCTCEVRNVKKDGTPFWSQIWVVRFEHPDHGLVNVGVQADISDRKQIELERQQAEQALQANAAQLKLALEAAQMSTWEWDLLTNRATFSEHLGPVSGLPLGSSYPDYDAFLNAVHPDDRDFVHQSHLLALNGSEYAIEFRMFWSDGSIHWLSNRGHVYCNEQGQPVRMLGIAMDITDRKLTEEAWQRSEATLSDILNTTIAAIARWYVFPDYRVEVEYRSAGCEQVFGYTAAEMMADPNLWLSRVLPEDMEAMSSSGFQNIFAQRPVNVEYRFYDKAGSIRWISDTLMSRYDAANECWVVTSVGIDITDRKQAEEALRQREQELRALVENAPDIICRFDHQFRFRYVNPRIVVETGIPIDAWIGKTELEMSYPEAQILPWYQVLQQVFDTGKEYAYESERAFVNGKLKYWSSRLVPEFAEDGSITSVLVVSRDITSLKQAQAALVRSESQYRLLFENNPNPMWIFDPKTGIFLAVNHAAIAYYGYSETEFLRMRVIDLCAPEDFPSLQTIETGTAWKTIPHTVECRHLKQNGDLIYVEMNCYPITWADQLAHFTLAKDVTDRKRAEAEIRFQANLLSQVRNAIIATDLKGQITYWNRFAETLYQWTAPEVLGRSVMEMLVPTEQRSQIAIEFSGLQQDLNIEGEIVLQRKDGSVLPVLAATAAIQDNQGQLVGFVGVSVDISEQKQAEEALRRQAEREQLLRLITQRIRQSLDVEQILATTVIEVQQTLQADRALILRLFLNNSGETCSGQIFQEATAPDLLALKQREWFDVCWPRNCEEYYRLGQPRIVTTTAIGDLNACLAQMMEQIGVKSKIVAPIVQTLEDGSTKIWGLLIVHACSSDRQWQHAEAEFLQQISNQLAIAIQQGQLYQQTQQQAQRAQTLNRVVQAIRNSLDLNTIFSTAVAEVGRLLHITRTNIVQYLPDRGIWLTVAAYDQDVSLPSKLGVEIADQNNPLAARLKRFEVVQIDDTDQLTDDVNRELAQSFPGSWLLVPLKVEQQLWGSLSLSKFCPSIWKDFEVDLVLAVADQLAIAIQQANLYRRLQIELTERKYAEKALRNSEARFRKTFADAPIGMVLSDLRGQIVQVNRALCQMLGYSEPELTQLNLNTLIHPDDPELDSGLLQQLFNRELPLYRLEKRLLKQNGEVVWVSLTAGLLQEPSTGSLYCLRMYENITERRTMEQMKDNFISVVSHELRTPLTSIRGALALLATGQLGSFLPEGQELITIATAESQRLGRLVNDILDLERIKSGHISLVKEVCRVQDLIARSIESIRPISKEAQIYLEVSSVDEQVWADSDRIIQTLTNLLNNAIKFSNPNSTVWVTAETVTETLEPPVIPLSMPRSLLLFTVRDQGRGIPADKLEAIFKPFEQVSVSDARQKGGSGLGLAICQSIVQQHQGKIWATSTLGQGSSFFFTLPKETP
ncbi:MAG: PAS domain S-box protein [Scytolyngbya sp. HA4215-MV1]|jgi:PAS domain S-box-containing protein|nr:PAS domain S-box protein [Scytolyngbya sp. HA4215-MV1]